jgi:hypothetical protein
MGALVCNLTGQFVARINASLPVCLMSECGCIQVHSGQLAVHSHYYLCDIVTLPINKFNISRDELCQI